MAISVNPGPDNIWIDGTPVSKAQVRTILDDIISDANDTFDGLVLNGGRVFGSRAQAVSYGQENLASNFGLLFVREGDYIQVRGPGVANDALFEEHPRWGILDRIPVDRLFVATVSQAGIIHLVNQAATVDDGNTLITADIANATLAAGLTIDNGGTKVMLRVPSVIEGELSLQITGDTARAIRTERNTANATAEDVEPGGYIMLVKLSDQWVIQSGAFGSETIRAIKSSLALMGAVDGFDGANTEGYLTKGNGQIASASATWTYTDFIPVRTGQVFEYIGGVRGDIGCAIACYNANQAYLFDALIGDPEISGIQNVSGSVTIPDGVSYIRASTVNNIPHSLRYVPFVSATAGDIPPEKFAEDVVTVFETASGVTKIRLRDAIDSILNSSSALPSSLANLPGAGDSFTVGANATSPANRYLNRVAAALGATVTNYGQGGRVLQNSAMDGGQPQTNNFRDRFRSIFTGAEKKDFCLIAYGFNDARYTAAQSTFNVAAYQNDYREILAGLLCEGYSRDQILVVGPHYITDVGLETGSTGFAGQTRAGFEAYVAAAHDVAEEFGVLYFDSYAYMRDNGGASLIDTDDIHPNNTGHEVIATGIIDETTVLNQRPATTVIDFRSTPDAIHMAWTPVSGAVSYDYTIVDYDDLNIPSSPVNISGTSAQISTAPLGMKAVLMVRPVFSDGAGPWSASSPVDV